ncbi:hypothetical protein A245_30993 [Pseudomonas syringae pv. actinidiae ICMP 19096]|uniref:Uncharacterized protein n=1 Tax=Pseudomonas syringae pv. actinidiae ICMP 19096 TaxID=1194405 RepID=A0A656JRB2_PSESF|nr:hypothetical protein A245_30993 [Pseudomonas syringae pv. actinidiae ICMP 19096]
MLGNAGLDLSIARVFGNQHVAYGRSVETVERFQGALQQVESTTTGDHQRDVAVFAEYHHSFPIIEYS